jgi:guanylate kinase
MICILGESGCGKSTVERILADTYGFKRIISTTSRSKREHEIDGVDYNFVSVDDFVKLKNRGHFAETGNYRNWLYGTPLDQCTDDKVCVVTPSGLRQLKKNPELNIMSVYIKIDRRDRLIKLLQRDSDIEECCRRSLSDCGQFDGLENEVDFVINNDEYDLSPEVIAEMIVCLYGKGGVYENI